MGGTLCAHNAFICITCVYLNLELHAQRTRCACLCEYKWSRTFPGASADCGLQFMCWASYAKQAQRCRYRSTILVCIFEEIEMEWEAFPVSSELICAIHSSLNRKRFLWINRSQNHIRFYRCCQSSRTASNIREWKRNWLYSPLKSDSEIHLKKLKSKLITAAAAIHVHRWTPLNRNTFPVNFGRKSTHRKTKTSDTRHTHSEWKQAESRKKTKNSIRPNSIDTTLSPRICIIIIIIGHQSRTY